MSKFFRTFVASNLNIMDYLKLLQNEAYDELAQAAIPIAPTNPQAAEALLRMCSPENNLFQIRENKTLNLIKRYAKIGNPYAQYVYARWLLGARPSEDAVSQGLPLMEKAHQAGIADAGAALSRLRASDDSGQKAEEPLKATGEALENYWKTCVQYCEQAEHILQEQAAPAPIVAMANEVIKYGKWLGQFEHMLSKAYAVTKRMAACIHDNPRLLLQLKEVELEVLDYIQAVQHHELGIADDLREEIEELKKTLSI